MKYIMAELRDNVIACRWETVRFMFRFITGTW